MINLKQSFIRMGSCVCVVGTLFFFLCPTIIHAQDMDNYEVYYHPTNFVNKQKVVGTSVSLELAAIDVYWKFGGSQDHPFLANKEFKLVAHQDLSGANCFMTQSMSDGNGRFKGTCSASTTGRFVFHVEPRFPDFPKSKEYEIEFVSSKDSAETSPDPNMPKYTVTEITTDKGPCSSGFSSSRGFVHCSGNDYSAEDVTCRNGYSAHVDYGKCMGINDPTTDHIIDSVCDDPRCGKKEPSPLPKKLPIIKTAINKQSTSSGTEKKSSASAVVTNSINTTIAQAPQKNEKNANKTPAAILSTVASLWQSLIQRNVEWAWNKIFKQR